MSKLVCAAIAAAMIAAVLPCAAQAADACATLNGGRWAIYLEGMQPPSPGKTISIWTFDFRAGPLKNLGVGGADKEPATLPTSSSASGMEELTAVLSCEVVPRVLNTALLHLGDGGALTVTLAADGVSGTVKGAHATTEGLSGPIIRFH